MLGTMLIIKPEGRNDSDVLLNKVPSLEELQAAVGGPIQRVPQFNKYQARQADGRYLPKECMVYCHENGKMLGLEANNKATSLWNECLRAGFNVHDNADYLVGDIVILYGDVEFMRGLEE